jgi:hypothetical protein
LEAVNSEFRIRLCVFAFLPSGRFGAEENEQYQKNRSVTPGRQKRTGAPNPQGRPIGFRDRRAPLRRTPGPTAPERPQILQKDFMDTLRDPALRVKAEKARMEIHPVDGAAISRLIAELYDPGPEVIVTARDILQPGEKSANSNKAAPALTVRNAITLSQNADLPSKPARSSRTDSRLQIPTPNSNALANIPQGHYSSIDVEPHYKNDLHTGREHDSETRTHGAPMGRIEVGSIEKGCEGSRRQRSEEGKQCARSSGSLARFASLESR